MLASYVINTYSSQSIIIYISVPNGKKDWSQTSTQLVLKLDIDRIRRGWSCQTIGRLTHMLSSDTVSIAAGVIVTLGNFLRRHITYCIPATFIWCLWVFHDNYIPTSTIRPIFRRIFGIFIVRVGILHLLTFPVIQLYSWGFSGNRCKTTADLTHYSGSHETFICLALEDITRNSPGDEIPVSDVFLFTMTS